MTDRAAETLDYQALVSRIDEFCNDKAYGHAISKLWKLSMRSDDGFIEMHFRKAVKSAIPDNVDMDLVIQILNDAHPESYQKYKNMCLSI